MRRRTCKILVIGLSLGWFAASASANQLTNGNFSQTGTSCNDASEPQDSIPCSWGLDGPATVSNMNVISSAELPSGLAPPTLYTGNYVAFAGGGGGQDCLDQFISTTKDDDYTVTFYAALVGPDPGNAYLTFQWDASGPTNCTQPSSLVPCQLGQTGNQTVFQFDANVLPTTDTLCSGTPCFNYYSYTFTASTTGTTQVYFHGADLDAGTGSGNGGNFVVVADADIEQLSPSPEPTSLLLITSGLAIVWCRRFRKQKTRKNGIQ